MISSPWLQGIYMPLFAFLALFLWAGVTHLILPMLRKQRRVRDNLLTVGIVGMTLMLAWETFIYFGVRNFEFATHWNEIVALVWTPKLVGTCSLVAAVGGVSHAITGDTKLRHLIPAAVALWLVGVGVAALARHWGM